MPHNGEHHGAGAPPPGHFTASPDHLPARPSDGRPPPRYAGYAHAPPPWPLEHPNASGAQRGARRTTDTANERCRLGGRCSRTSGDGRGDGGTADGPMDVRAMDAAEKRLNAGRCSVVWTAVPTDGDPVLRSASRCRMERVILMAGGAVVQLKPCEADPTHAGMHALERTSLLRPKPMQPRALVCKRATNMPARRCLCSIFRAVF